MPECYTLEEKEKKDEKEKKEEKKTTDKQIPAARHIAGRATVRNVSGVPESLPPR